MFTITDFDSKEKVVENIGTINEFGRSTQLRIYDLLTGVYSRILPQTDGRYVLTESGISARDPVDGELEITIEGEVKKDEIGEYKIIVKATDKNSNETSAEFTVKVKEKPVVTTRPATSSSSNKSSNTNSVAT